MTTIADPLTLRSGLTLSNRIAKAAMTENLADRDNQPTTRHERVYRRWADGGAGLLLTGNVMVDRRYLERSANVVVDGGVDMDRLAAFAASTGDVPALAQVGHPGRQCNRLLTSDPVAPSAGEAVQLMGPTFAPPRALTPAEVERVADDFVATSRRCVDAGFDGVQIHAAHGYLLAQFLSPLTNRRTDTWGGDLAGRAALLRTIVVRVRRELGPDVTLAVKLNSSDFQRGGFSEDEAVEVAQWLDEDGIDLLEISGGTYESMALLGMADGQPGSPGSDNEREAYFAGVALRIKDEVDVPVLLTGGIRSRASMDALLDAGSADVIGLGRPLALDPGLPARLLDGTSDGIELPTHEPPALLRAAGESEWYEVQIGRMGDGLEPDPTLDATRAALSFLAGETSRGIRNRRRRLAMAARARA